MAGAGVEGGFTHEGFSVGNSTGTYLDGLPFGSLAPTSAPGGEVINNLYWDDRDNITYLSIVGSGKSAWFTTNPTIWINGTAYSFSGAGNAGGVTYAVVSTSKVFTSGASYSVFFTAPGVVANASAAATISLGGSAVAVAPARAVANGAISLSGAAVVSAPVVGQVAGLIALSGGGAAAVPAQAQAAGLISLSGSAVASVGTASTNATASVIIALTGAAIAAATVKADGAGMIALSGAGAVAVGATANAAGVIALSGAGAAGLVVGAQGAASIALTGSGAAAYGVPAIAPPAGVFPDAQAALDVVTHFNAGLSTGTYVRTGSGYTVTGAASLVFTLPAALTGNYWVSYSVLEEQPGSHRAGYLSPTYTPNALRSRGRNQVFNTPVVAGSTQVRIITSSGFAGEIEDIQLIDMATYLAMPADVWVAWWQSNMAATTQSLGYDKAQDAWADPRLQCFPGAANTQHGTTLGEITALRAPMQMQSNVAEALNPGMISAGVSPAVNFARNILPKVAAGRRLVIVGAAVSGTGIEGAAAAWNPASSNPFAYNHMMSLTAQAMAALPAGSIIRGMLGAGGESDTSADMSTHSAALNAVLVASGNAWVAAGFCAARPPCVLIGPPPDATRANQAVLVAAHAKLDRDSGDPTSIANVHVAATGGWGCEDSTHRTAAASRLAGTVAANLANARGLTASVAVITATAAATIPLTGSAASAAPVQAQSASTIALGGSAAATSGVAALAQGSVSLTGAAASQALLQGQGQAMLALSGSGAATSQAKAVASALLTLTGAASAVGGVAPIMAQATATIGLAGSAAALVIAQAQAAAQIALAGAAAARADATAQGAVAIQIGGSAVAMIRAAATAGAVLSLGSSGTAFALLQAIAAGFVPLSGSAVGSKQLTNIFAIPGQRTRLSAGRSQTALSRDKSLTKAVP